MDKFTITPDHMGRRKKANFEKVAAYLEWEAADYGEDGYRVLMQVAELLRRLSSDA